MLLKLISIKLGGKSINYLFSINNSLTLKISYFLKKL